jgi:hypothetical protein
VLLKQKKKVKKTKKKKENHFEFFSLRQVSTKEESKGFPKQRKMDEKSGKPSSVVERLILKGESEMNSGEFI